MAKKQRSEYLQSLLENKKNLEERLNEVAKGTVSSIVSENIEKNIRKILSEGEDDFTEDEVDEPEGLDNGTDVTDDDVAVSDGEGTDDLDTDEVEDGDGDEAVDVESEDDSTWDDIEEYKDEDGEYDLTGMGTQDVIKVLQVMSPEDGVRVVKNDNGSVTLSDDSTGKEYILDIEGSFGDGTEGADTEIDVDAGVGDAEIEIDTTVGDSEVEDDDMDVDVEIEDETDDDFGGEDDDFEDDDDDLGDDEGEDFEDDEESDDDAEIEIESDEDDDELSTINESNVIKNFQNKTAMTTPENGPAEGDAFDGGLPKGTEKRFEKKKGKGKPFGVNECDEPGCEGKECEGDKCVNETHTVGGKAFKRTTGRTDAPDTNRTDPGKNAHKAGKKVTKTSDSAYQPSSSVEESIKRKANAIFVENKQLKTLIPKLQKQVMEAIVINKSMGNVMKLVMENSTTINEKKSILERFSKVKTIEESDKLYGTIAEELKRDGKTLNLNNAISAQLSESKMNNVKEETPMYINEGVSNVLDLMKRMGM